MSVFKNPSFVARVASKANFISVLKLSLLTAACALKVVSSHADLTGDSVHANYLYPNTAGVYINFPNANVTAAGTSFDIFGHDTFTVFPAIIDRKSTRELQSPCNI